MITKDMTIAQTLAVSRELAPIMMEYGMHCLGCPMSQRETLEQACSVHGADVDEMVEKLNAFLAEK